MQRQIDEADRYRIDGQLDRQMDSQIDRWTDIQTDRKLCNACMYIVK